MKESQVDAWLSSSASSTDGTDTTTTTMGANRQYTPVVIIGAGFSGVVAGCNLKRKLGFQDYVIFDRNADIGGTWFTNCYPGCGVDIPSFLYDLSFAHNRQYPKFLPKQPAILKYIKDVAHDYNVDSHLRLSTSFESASWDEQSKRWILRLRDATKDEVFEYECQVLMMCCGNLADPTTCDIPGLDKFKGKVMHTGKWDRTIDLQDQRMAVIGNGPSATQLIPAVQNKVKSLHQFMRSPQHLFACHNPSYNKTWQNLLQKTPMFYGTARNSFFWFLEVAAVSVRRSGKVNPAREFLRTQSLRHTVKYAPEEYLDMLTPSFDVGCKRRVLDNGYLKSLQRDHMHLTNEGISHIDEDGVVTQSGKKVEVDIIVTATGFSNPQTKLNITGRGGATLQKHWEQVGGLSAYKSIAVADFPNFFFVYGPNGTPGHSTALHFIEKYTEMIIKIIKPVISGKARSVEVRKDVEYQHAKDVQAALSTRVWGDQCSSYYVDRTTGWNGSISPYGAASLWGQIAFLDKSAWIYENKTEQTAQRVAATVDLATPQPAAAGVAKSAAPGNAPRRASSQLSRDSGYGTQSSTLSYQASRGHAMGRQQSLLRRLMT